MILAPFIRRHPKLGRWLYAGVAALGAAGFALILFRNVSDMAQPENDNSYQMVLITALVAFIAAMICWPRHKRGLGRMILAGFTTVATAFLIFLPIQTLFTGEFEFSKIDEILAASFGMFLLGSLFTVGIPYIVGVCLSLLFIDGSKIVGDTES